MTVCKLKHMLEVESVSSWSLFKVPQIFLPASPSLLLSVCQRDHCECFANIRLCVSKREGERSFVVHFTISPHRPVSFGEVDVFLQLVRAVSALFKNAASTQLIMQINSCFVVVTLNNLPAHFQLYKTRKVVLTTASLPCQHTRVDGLCVEHNDQLSAVNAPNN